jgi:hypothetical protein
MSLSPGSTKRSYGPLRSTGCSCSLANTSQLSATPNLPDFLKYKLSETSLSPLLGIVSHANTEEKREKYDDGFGLTKVVLKE